MAILDYAGYVLGHNQRFEHLTKAVRAQIDRNKKLTLRTEKERESLAAALGSHLGVVGGAFVMHAAEAGERWLGRVFPKPAFTVAGPEVGHALLVCEPLDTPLLLDQKLVQDVYGLTKTETEIANLVFRGESPRHIAQTRRISLETVRSHVKSLLHKTESGRQAELVAKLARLTDQSGA